MYDTVNFWINRSNIKGGISFVPACLNDAVESVNRDTGEAWIMGRIEDLKITVSMAGVAIKGSLAKFFYPDNTYTLTRHDAKEAVEKLSDALCLPVKDARVTRIDIATNFILENEVRLYFDVLGLCTYYDRSHATDNTLYYHNKGKNNLRTMAFYDKTREVSDRHGTIPDVYDDTNLLRYEMRWNTRLPQQLNEPEVNGSLLYEPRFYHKIIKAWAGNYFKIEKKRQFNTEAMDDIKTVSDGYEYICAIALNRMTPGELQGMLNALKAKKVYDHPTYYTRLKKMIADTKCKLEISKNDELVKELDGEVRQVLAYMR